MGQILYSRITLSVFSVFALFVCGARAQATDISGTISTTLTIFEDSELVGDVTCTVADAWVGSVDPHTRSNSAHGRTNRAGVYGWS